MVRITAETIEEQGPDRFVGEDRAGICYFRPPPAKLTVEFHAPDRGVALAFLEYLRRVVEAQ